MRWIAAACALSLLAACGGGDDDDPPAASSITSSTTSTTTGDAPSSTSETTTASTVPLSEVSFTLTQVADLSQPLAFAVRDGVAGFYVGEKGGRVQHVASDGATPTTVLDISGDVSTGGEQGLLGIAISPDGSNLYVSYTNVDGDTRVDEHPFTGDTSVGPRRELFAQDQPYANHNGGHITFGPDGLLWLGLGDGGAGGDPEGRAQDAGTLLGKIIRFDPAAPTPRPEIWALGLRNPWRFTFDRSTGEVWIGDVGQNQWEEISRLPWEQAGANFGWDLLEGTHPFEADDAAGTVLPVFEYDHSEGQSVAGGFVYRGSAIPGLVGTYLFADTYEGELRALR
ncbi:MAG TPA: PQQ-dependent sugar dehydrogenase, partial [Acidimicrobiales bacterium]|nr:PQQ-dependent sugar dehydrogenase [Acidimicrobiales bacterium]